jgi:hypothetical protein
MSPVYMSISVFTYTTVATAIAILPESALEMAVTWKIPAIDKVFPMSKYLSTAGS